MDIKITREKKYSIIVNEEELRLLVNFLASQYSPMEIVIKCNDGSTLTTSALDDITNFENSRFRKIEVIQISFGKSYSQGGSVEFNSKYSFLQTCEFTVRDNDDAKVLKVANEINTRLEECKTWYSIITKFPPSLSVAVIYFSIWLPNLYIKLFNNKLESHPAISIIDMFNITAIFLPAILLYIIGIKYLDKAWVWLFPKSGSTLENKKLSLKKEKASENLFLED